MSKLPDFEGLAMLAKVPEERSFAGAAKAIGVSVATVSRAVARLEERPGGTCAQQNVPAARIDRLWSHTRRAGV